MNNAELISHIWWPLGTKHKLESKQKHSEKKERIALRMQKHIQEREHMHKKESA